jgi:hypothetical protein
VLRALRDRLLSMEGEAAREAQVHLEDRRHLIIGVSDASVAARDWEEEARARRDALVPQV